MLKGRKHQVRQIRERLPYGSVSLIKKRMEQKGKPFSAQYISRCLNPRRSDFNQSILEEAITLGIEIERKQAELNYRILHFKKELP